MRFRVGLTADVRLLPDEGFTLLREADDVDWEYLDELVSPMTAEQLRGYDGLIVLRPRINAESLQGADRLSVLARVGVGYDSVDVARCAELGIAVTITPDGTRRPMASSALLFVLALAHRLLVKDRLTREGRWGESADHHGIGLTGRTLGIVGYGHIGRDLVTLAKPFGMRHLVADPYVTAAEGAELVELETLLSESDFVVVTCPLTDETRHLIDAPCLALMKPEAFLVNIARGPIVDQAALTEALLEGRIQGAALDVFEQEPIDPADPLLSLDNVILAPHAIGHTDEVFAKSGESACRSVLAVARGQMPEHVVNPLALEHPRFRARLQ